jgi:hypothetical protein
MRGVIDVIFGDVFVVWAKFLATDVVTLLCNKLSDMFTSWGLKGLSDAWENLNGLVAARNVGWRGLVLSAAMVGTILRISIVCAAAAGKSQPRHNL